MALTIGDATYGRDKATIDKLISDYQTRLDATAKALTGGDVYKRLKDTIRENWVGEDAEAFINDISSDIIHLHSAVLGYKTKVKTALENSYDEFVKFQNHRY